MGDPKAWYRYGWEQRDGILRVGVLEKLAGLIVGRKERKFPEGLHD
jgi:hypothetical protein